MEHERTGELLVNLGSDQTSLHNPYGGGYYPVQISFDEAQDLMKTDTQRFKELVQERCIAIMWYYFCFNLVLPPPSHPPSVLSHPSLPCILLTPSSILLPLFSQLT